MRHAVQHAQSAQASIFMEDDNDDGNDGNCDAGTAMPTTAIMMMNIIIIMIIMSH
jgi:hypothetical protein